MKITQLSLVAMSILGFSSMAMASTPSLAASTPPAALLTIPKEDSSFSGSFHLAHASEYTGRGLLISNVGLQRDGSSMALLKMQQDFNESWSLAVTLAYVYASDGNTLFELQSINSAYPAQNIENEFVAKVGAIYTDGDFSIGFGHNFIHGGLLGAMSKHFGKQSNSAVSEIYIEPEYDIFPWLSIGTAINFSYVGVKGWWFEPHIKFKAPIIGTADDVTLGAILAFHLSATGDYFQNYHGASKNGTQAFWVKLSTPWYVDEAKRIVITPSFSLNWLGKGALHANKNSHAATIPGTGPKYVPFKTFGMVGSIMLSYKF